MGLIQCHPDISRLDQAWHSGWMVTFETRQVKSRTLDVRNRVSVEMTTERQFRPDRRHSVLPLRKVSLCPGMFQKQETPASLEHTRDFGKSVSRVRNAAENERGDYSVKGP